ncbi:MAG TPA: exo-alpha-sialidase, partial [Bryobacteraceae bacterium]|nr:exo-alpha-sialidase [Bryobacteraceae bacterium]
ALTSSNRKSWTMAGPHFKGWDVNHVSQDPRDPKRLYAAVNSAWFGPHIHASTNGGKTWKLSEKGLELKCVPNESIKRVWNICPGAADEPGVVYAGADPGALFRSGDWGKSWEEVPSLTAHSTRGKWTPGAGGMCLHSIQCLGNGRMVIAISAAGAFRTFDGGATWSPFNGNVRADFQPDKFPEVGQCVHKLLAHPNDPEALYQQNHCGIYRAKLTADKWTDISRGLPSRFGFGLAVPAAEPQTLFTVPIDSAEYRANPEGKFRVARSRDGGKNWTLLTRGLPQKNAHLLVLRESMTSDALDPAGVYVGTTSGQVFHTRDAGNSWQILADNLPQVYSLSVATA